MEPQTLTALLIVLCFILGLNVYLQWKLYKYSLNKLRKLTGP